MNKVPLRRRLFLLVAAGIAPVALMSGIALLAFFHQQSGEANRAGLDITRALATAVHAETRRTVAVLEVIASSPLLDTDDIATYRARVQASLAAQPYWRAVILAQPDATPVFNSHYTEGPLPPINEMASFQRVVRERRPVVGDLAQGPGGEWAVPIRVPVERAGKLRYVLTAVVSPDAFLEIVQRQKVPSDWVVSVFDSKDQRVARSRDAQYFAAPPSPSLKELMDNNPVEGMGLVRTMEGESTYSSFTRLSDPRWTIAIGIPPSAVDLAAWRSLAVYGGGVLLSIAIGLGVALWVARSINAPIASLRSAAHSLGRGERFDLPSTDIRELQEVGDALAASSFARQQHEAEREELLRRAQSAREYAEAANKSKDEFLAMLGHELRNPLGAISNAASLLNDARSREETRRQAGEIIVRQVGHLTRLTDDLLDAARALTGKIVLERRPIDLGSAAAQALRTLKAAGRTQKHRIVEVFESVWIDADPIRIDQIISNLVGNAAKYTPTDGNILVVVASEGSEAVLRVVDTGVGLSPELATRVFDLFVQGDRELDRSLGGLGIGLTLVRRLAEMHGGRVDVRSSGPGQGSEFIVRLPSIPAPAHEGARREVLPTATGCDVLVVEDNDDARETLQMLLELAGHRVRSERDGPAGLHTALATHPDVMLVDIGLPQMDGYEVARRLREATNGGRPYMVAVTGYGTPEDRQRAMDAGFDAHVVKPVDFDVLTEVLTRRP